MFQSENNAVDRARMLANQANCPVYFVHLYSSKSADIVRKARRNGRHILLTLVIWYGYVAFIFMYENIRITMTILTFNIYFTNYRYGNCF